MRLSFVVIAVTLAASSMPGLSLPLEQRDDTVSDIEARGLSRFLPFRKTSKPAPAVAAPAQPEDPWAKINKYSAISSLISGASGMVTGLAQTAQSKQLNDAQIKSLNAQTEAQNAANAQAAQAAQAPPPDQGGQAGGDAPPPDQSGRGGAPGYGPPPRGGGGPPQKRDALAIVTNRAATELLRREHGLVEPSVQHLQARQFGMMPYGFGSVGKTQKAAAALGIGAALTEAATGIASLKSNAELNKAQIASLDSQTAAAQAQTAALQGSGAPPPSQPPQRRSLDSPVPYDTLHSRDVMEQLSRRAASELWRRDPNTIISYAHQLQARAKTKGGFFSGLINRLKGGSSKNSRPAVNHAPPAVNHAPPAVNHAPPAVNNAQAPINAGGSSKLQTAAGLANIAGAATGAVTSVAGLQSTQALNDAQIQALNAQTSALPPAQGAPAAGPPQRRSEDSDPAYAYTREALEHLSRRLVSEVLKRDLEARAGGFGNFGSKVQSAAALADVGSSLTQAATSVASLHSNQAVNDAKISALNAQSNALTGGAH